MKKKIKPLIYFALFIIALSAFFYKRNIQYPTTIKLNHELYNPELNRIDNMDKAILYIDSLARIDSPSSFDTLNFIKKATRFTKENFYHGLANYSIHENWIANIFGRLFWSHFAAKVIPDDIIKSPKGICSQQSIVYMEILKRKGITCRSVGLGYVKGPGHFLTEVRYNNAWHLYDVNLEPEWKNIEHRHESMEYYINNKDTLYLAYKSKLSPPLFNKLMEQVTYGKPNAFPAPRMYWFQKLTKWITYVLPLLFFSLFLYSFIGSKKKDLTTRKKEETLKDNIMFKKQISHNN